jgi:hypothetical protein
MRTTYYGTVLALCAASGLNAQQPTVPAAGSKPAPSGADYRSLRFDESWPAASTGRWDDRLKHIQLAGDRPLTLTVGGQVRWREESFRAFNLGAQNDDHTQSRVLLSADVRAGERRGWNARVFGEVRDAQSYGRTLPGGARPTDMDRGDVQNLFADVGHGASFVRVGRQEIALNRERLFGVPDWANTRRGSEGVRAQLTVNRFAVDLIQARPLLVRQTLGNRADSTAQFRVLAVGNAAGAKPFTKALPAVWQAYWYEQQLNGATTRGTRHTTGGRLQWQFTDGKRGHVRSLEFEGATQHGELNGRPLRAWFWVTEAQYQWKRQHGAPSVALGVETASGERQGTTDALQAFAVLYPAAHAHGGYADVIGRANVRELHLIATWAPVRSVDLRAAAYRFDRLRLDDGVYNKQNGLFRAAGDNRDRHAADELDVTGTWKVSRHWRAIFGGAVVVPGPFLKRTAGSARTERWSFVGTAFTF